MLVKKATNGSTRILGRNLMKLKFASVMFAAATFTMLGHTAGAQTAGVSDDVVKIGVLTDMSGQFSHESGEGSVTAIKMAVEDFGGKVLGMPIEVVFADHQNKPDIAAARHDLQALNDKGAVQALERHHVANCSKRHDIE